MMRIESLLMLLSYFILYYITTMIKYRSYYIIERNKRFLILDEDKMPVDVQETLAKAKHLIDLILENIPDIPDIAA